MGSITMNQRVGILSGIMLLVGSLMSAYYGDTNLWAWATFVTFAFVFWTHARTWTAKSTFDIAWLGFLMGILSAFVTRLGGLIVTRLMFDQWRPDPAVEYDILNNELIDAFKVVLNGDLNQTIGFVALAGILGAMLAAGSFLISAQMKERG